MYDNLFTNSDRHTGSPNNCTLIGNKQSKQLYSNWQHYLYLSFSVHIEQYGYCLAMSNFDFKQRANIASPFAYTLRNVLQENKSARRRDHVILQYV